MVNSLGFINRQLQRVARLFPQDSRIRTKAASLWSQIIEGQTLSISVNGRDVLVPSQLRRMGSTFELELVSLQPTTTTKVATVFDIGANIGLFPLMFDPEVMVPRGEEPTYHLYEPDGDNFQLMTSIASINGLSERTNCHKLGIFDQCGKLTFHRDAQSGNSDVCAHLLIDDAESSISGGVLAQVDVVTIDSECERLGTTPELIKLDIEGAEIHALRGATKTMAGLNPDKQKPLFLLELHPQFWHRFSVTQADLLAVLAETNYQITDLNKGAIDLEKPIPYGQYLLSATDSSNN